MRTTKHDPIYSEEVVKKIDTFQNESKNKIFVTISRDNDGKSIIDISRKAHIDGENTLINWEIDHQKKHYLVWIKSDTVYLELELSEENFVIDLDLDLRFNEPVFVIKNLDNGLRYVFRGV